MESKTKNRKTAEEIGNMCLRAFGKKPSKITEYTEGWYNAVYGIAFDDGKEAVLKIAPPTAAETLTYEKNMMSTEVASMRLVRSRGRVPVPEILFYDDSGEVCDTDYFFMEKADGENYAHVKENLMQAQRHEIEYQTGVYTREMNSITGTYYGYEGNPKLRGNTWREAYIKILAAVLEDGRRKHIDIGFEYDDILRLAEDKAPALDEVTTPHFVHWDVWDSNVFVKDGRVTAIIDFERALWADPLMEQLFRMYFMPSAAMEGYGKTAFTANEEIRMQLYSLHLFLIMLIECYYRCYDTDENEKMARQALAQTVGWLREH
jgi:aminoglycoside phosphotransferase (APT) family kinase protein